MKRTVKRMLIGLLAAVAVIVIAGYAMSFTAGRPATLGLTADGHLAPPPTTPNCVSSDADPTDSHYIAPLPAADWSTVVATVAALPRTTIITERDGYLHAECRSLIFRFCDDLELHQRADQIAVRSASRVGHSDLGVNRARVEALRQTLEER